MTMRCSWLLLVALLLAPSAEAAPSWIEDVREATVRDADARACALPRIIRYQSTRALLERAAREPERYTRATVKAWRLRLLEIKRAAQACLPDASPAAAELVVEVDLPPGVFADDWFADDRPDDGPLEERFVFVPVTRPDARPPLVN